MKLIKLFAFSLAMLLVGSAMVLDRAYGFDHHAEEKSETNEEQWIVLFDGTSTEHWRGYRAETFPEKGWQVVDGSLQVIAKAQGGDIVTKQQFDSFELVFEWKVSHGANSGVMYHVAEGPDLRLPFFSGPEYQILEDENHRNGRNPKTSAAALYGLIACNDKKKLAEVGQWNKAKIIVDGSKVEHWLNGEVVVEYDLESEAFRELVENSHFKQWPGFATHGKGHIALQDHGDNVWFRDIRIREIDNENDKDKDKDRDSE